MYGSQFKVPKSKPFSLGEAKYEAQDKHAPFNSSTHHTMKKKPELEDDDRHHEILKAVAQAWQSHTGSSKPATEFDAHRRNCRANPSRFKIEAMRSRCSAGDHSGGLRWNFAQSLWDSYEIVTVSKRLERGLVLDGDGFREADAGGRIHRRRRESCNSLRNLFNRASSRRFNVN